MDKFISIEAALNYVPNTILENTPKSQLLQWMYQYVRMNAPSSWKYSWHMLCTTVNNHKAELPQGVVKIAAVLYSSNNICEVDCNDTESLPAGLEAVPFINEANPNDCRYIIQQQAVVDPVLNKDCFPLKYRGQDAKILTDGCVNLFCKGDGFSVDRMLSCITTDPQSGYLCVVYKTLITEFTDGKNTVVIPDDPDLLEALALYAEAKFWQDRSAKKEAGAENLFSSRLRMASTKMREALGKRHLRGLKVNMLSNFIFNRFKIQKLDSVSGNNRNKNYRR